MQKPTLEQMNAALALIAAELDAAVTDRLDPSHDASRCWQYLRLPDGHMVGVELIERTGRLSFFWASWPMYERYRLLPSDAAERDEVVPDFSCTAAYDRPAAKVAAQVRRSVIEPALVWYPRLVALIERKRAQAARALEAAQHIARELGAKLDEERDVKGAEVSLWIPEPSPFGKVEIHGYHDSVSIYPSRVSNLNVAQFLAMLRAYRDNADKEG